MLASEKISSMDNVVILDIVGLCHELCHRLNFVKLPGAYLQWSLGTTENNWCLGEDFWACQPISVAVKTSKGYECHSGLLSVAVPAKVSAFYAPFRMIKAERSCLSKSLHPVLDECWMMLLWIIEQNMRAKILVAL